VDVSNPSVPVKMASCDTRAPALDVVAAGNYAYIAAGEAGLRVVDISDPNAPTEVGFYDTPGNAVGVDVVDSYVYLADTEVFRVIDVSNPMAPIETSSYSASDNSACLRNSGGRRLCLYQFEIMPVRWVLCEHYYL
jgi:hypothetical protein